MSRLVWIALCTAKIMALVLWLKGSAAWGAALWLGIDVFLLYQLFVPSSQALCRAFTRFETERNEIWLTIDDGPDTEDTPLILDLLDRHRAKATFFLIGERAALQPQIVAEILRRGHEVAHHTHTHPTRTFWCAGPARVRRELDDALAALQRAGARPHWFRSPVGIKNFFLGAALRRRGLEYASWSVRSYDSKSVDPAKIAARVMLALRPGAIVLMHEGAWLDARVRVHGLEHVLTALTERGFTCVLPDRAQLR